MGTRTRGGQAMIEAAIGMLAFALVLSALFAFAAYIVKSLDLRRTLRAEAGTRALATPGNAWPLVKAGGEKRLRVDSVAAEYVFGKTELTIREEAAFPPMTWVP